MMVRGLWPALLFGAACASTAPTPTVALPEPAPSWREGDDRISATMRRIAMQLGGAGLRPGNMSVRGFIAGGARRAYPVVVAKDTCTTIVAIASSGIHDMDAALYTPEGEPLATDSQPDAHPTIQVCAGNRTRSLYYTLQAYQGAGSFLIVDFLSDASSLRAAGLLLGGEPGVARLSPAAGSSMANRVTNFSHGMKRRGFKPHEEPLRVPLVEGQKLRLPIIVEAGQCYTAVGFVHEGLLDVNLRVLDAEGVEIGRDDSPVADASTQFCPRRPGEYALEVHSAGGSGIALVMLFRASASAVGGSAGLWLGRRQGKLALLPLEVAETRAAARNRRQGYRSLGQRVDGRLGPGQAVAHAIRLPAKRCLRLLVTGGAGLGLLSLRLADAAGASLVSAEGRGGRAYVHLCTTEETLVSVQLIARGGSGRYALSVWERKSDPVGDEPTSPRVRARWLQLSLEAEDAGFRAYPKFDRGLRRVLAGQDGTAELALDLDAGQCVRAYVLDESGKAKAKLLSDDGKTLAMGMANGAPLRACRSKGMQGDLRLELTDGDAWLMLYLKARTGTRKGGHDEETKANSGGGR